MATAHAARDAPSRPMTRARRILRLAVIALVVGGSLLFVDPREVGHILSRVPPGILALAILILSVDRFIMGYKWRHLIQGAGARMRVSEAVSIYYQSKFTTLVFPASFGGEVLRGVLATRAGVPSHIVMASMVLERVVAAISSLCLAGLGLVYLSTLPVYDRYSDTVMLIVVAAGACLAAVALTALNRPSHKLVGRAVRRWVPEHLFRFFDQLSATAVRYKHAPRLLLANLGMTVFEHLLQMLAFYVLAVGLGVHLSFLHFFAATAIIMLVRRGAGFLEGWGIIESGVVMLYTLFGVGASRSAALALALWAISLVTCIPGGLLLWRGAWRGISSAGGPARENT
jgi:uncharacterized protein (TIRG00374 family)